MSFPEKILFIPPRVLTLDILQNEFKTTADLVYNIEAKYVDGRSRPSKLMRRFFRYQPYVFLRNKIIGAEIYKRTNVLMPDYHRSIVKFGLSYYSPSNKLIQTHCEEVYDHWEQTGQIEKLDELARMTTPEIHQELQFLFNIYKQKYGFQA